MKKILIVDDDPVVFLTTRMNIKSDGHLKVFEALSPEQALKIVANESIDMLVVDYSLGDSLGTSLAKTIKGLMPKIKIIVMTGNEKDRVETECLLAGADIVLDKTSLHIKLKESIRMLLSD